jgi:hypothetical protein
VVQMQLKLPQVFRHRGTQSSKIAKPSSSDDPACGPGHRQITQPEGS